MYLKLRYGAPTLEFIHLAYSTNMRLYEVATVIPMWKMVVWEWKNEKGDKIFKQLRTIGASLDWTNSKFTMSDVCSHNF